MLSKNSNTITFDVSKVELRGKVIVRSIVSILTVSLRRGGSDANFPFGFFFVPFFVFRSIYPPFFQISMYLYDFFQKTLGVK